MKMKSGTNKKTGAAMNGLSYLRQRLEDVINTPLGSLVGRRDFGSRLHELLDRNVNDEYQMNAYILLSESINNPANDLDDFKLNEMQIEKIEDAHYAITIRGSAQGEPVKIEGIKYG